jgi:hypothetical protein
MLGSGREGAVLMDLMSLPARNEIAASAARILMYLAHMMRAPVRIQNYEQGE